MGAEISELLNKNLELSPVTPKDIHGNSPLAIAAANSHKELVEILLTRVALADGP